MIWSKTADPRYPPSTSETSTWCATYWRDSPRWTDTACHELVYGENDADPETLTNSSSVLLGANDR